MSVIQSLNNIQSSRSGDGVVKRIPTDRSCRKTRVVTERLKKKNSSSAAERQKNYTGWADEADELTRRGCCGYSRCPTLNASVRRKVTTDVNGELKLDRSGPYNRSQSSASRRFHLLSRPDAAAMARPASLLFPVAPPASYWSVLPSHKTANLFCKQNRHNKAA